MSVSRSLQGCLRQAHGNTGASAGGGGRLLLGAPVSPLPTQHHAPSTVRDTFQKGKADTIYSGSFFSFLMERSFLKNGGRSFEI